MKDLSHVKAAILRNALLLQQKAPDLDTMTKEELNELLYKQCHSFKFSIVTVCVVEPTDKSSFPETFYASDRESAKGHADYPLTAEYIRRLEAIARAAIQYYNDARALSDLELPRSDLYSALEAVNSLDESLY